MRASAPKPASIMSIGASLSVYSRAADQHHEHHWERVRRPAPKPASIMSISGNHEHHWEPVRASAPKPASIMSINRSLSVQQPRRKPASSASLKTTLSISPQTSQHHEHQPEPVCPKAAPQASIISIIGNQSVHQPQNQPASRASSGACLSKSRAASQHHEHHWEPVRPSAPKPASIMSISGSLSVQQAS